MDYVEFLDILDRTQTEIAELGLRVCKELIIENYGDPESRTQTIKTRYYLWVGRKLNLGWCGSWLPRVKNRLREAEDRWLQVKTQQHIT